MLSIIAIYKPPCSKLQHRSIDVRLCMPRKLARRLMLQCCLDVCTLKSCLQAYN